MNRIVSTILTVTLALLLPLTAMAVPIGKATFIKGSVDITSPGKDAKPLQVNDDIEINDVIRTKSESKAEITFIDDSIMRVAERSRVEVQNYVINNESLNGTVKLYRGKIQNIVKTTGKAFGRLQQNKFEVHTPMAVVGVRGTNFFTYHQQFTGSTFQEGQGYGFSVGNPDQMVTITAGQSMVVRDVNQVPEVKEATESEMGGLAVETAPEDDQGSNEGDTGGDTAAAGDTGGTDETAADDAADAATDQATDAAASEAGAPDAGGPAGGEPGSGTGSGGAEPGPGPGAGPAAPGGMDLNLSLGDVAPTIRTAPGTTATTPTGTAPKIATAALPGVLSPAAMTMTPPPITTMPTTIYIPPTTITTPTATPQPFASTLSGSTYKLTAGTMVEDEKRIYDNSGYEVKNYNYQYFYDGSSIPFGSRDLSDYSTSPAVDWWEVYLPDSHYWKFNGLYPVPVVTTFSNWTVGSKAIADFTTNPTAEAWLSRVYHDYTSSATFVGTQYGTITGTMTGQNVFTATAASPATITLGGNTTVASDLLFKMQLSSNATTVGGAYEGYLGGIINSLLYGGITAIYVTDSGAAGFLQGSFAGTASGTTWGGTGTLYRTPVDSGTGVTPATLAANIDTGFIYGEYKGGIIGDGNSRIWNTGTGTTKSIRGQDWGIYALSFMLSPRAKNISTGALAWSGRVSGEAAFGTYQNSGGIYVPDSGIWMSTDIAGTLDTPEAGMFMSTYAGYFMTPFKIGIMGGTIRGAYTGTDDQWLATSGGTWETMQDLYFNGAFDSKAWQHGKNHTFKTMAAQQNRYVSGNSYYEWQASDGVNSGWTWQYNAGTTQSTLTKYYVDGRKRTWVFNLLGTPVLANGDLDPFEWNNNSLVSYTEGTYTISTTLAALLASGAPVGYTSQNWQPYYYLQTIGDFGDGEILLGGLSDIWTATPAAPASFIIAGDYGTYNDVGFLPGVYFSGINSGNMYDTTWTVMNPATKAQNGSYLGFVTGKTDTGFTTYGMITALYLDTGGNAGFLLGDYTGTVYPNADNDLLEPTFGGLFPTQVKASTGLTPSTLYTSSSAGGIVNDYSNSQPFQAEGRFFTDGTYATTNGIFTADFREANFASIGGGSGATRWSMAVGAIVRGGDYGSGSTDYWVIDWGAATYALTNGTMNPPIIDYNINNDPIRKRGFALGNPDNSDIGGQWSGGFIEGKSATSWMNMNNGINGISLGEIHGLFDPTSSATYMTWETVNNTIAMDTKTFMDLAGTTAGKAALQQMGFPSFAVGKTNLAGTIAVSGGSLGMTMTDVTFYAQSSGSPPLLWATNSVTGSFTGAPAAYNPGTPAFNTGTLTGSSSPNLETTVTLRSWNSPAGIWTADVSPSANATKVNLVKNLDGGATTQVKMYGQAGGAISGTTITGTASGVNQ